MTALAQPISADPTAAGEAVVVGVEVAAGHDGAAELVIQVRHENGVVAPVVLDPETGLALLKAAGAGGAKALIGRSWRDLFKLTMSGDA
jgi:hypothetical protein